MRNVMNTHPAEAIVPAMIYLSLGTLLGAMLTVRGVQAEERKAPPLPAAKVNWASCVQGPRQVLICGTVTDVNRRTNALMLEGWKTVPGSVAVSGTFAQDDHGNGNTAMIVLEQKPKSAR